MIRRTTLLLALCLVASLRANSSHAADTADASFAPIYEGTHVLPVMRAPGLPGNLEWSTRFMYDTNLVLARYGWYMAEITCFVDETGQVRDTVLTESIPSRNLSATIVAELRRKKWNPAQSPAGAVAGELAFRIIYTMQNMQGTLGNIGTRLRRDAEKGNASAQYTLSRLLLADVAFDRSGLDGDTLLRNAADPGGDRRAMLALAILGTSDKSADLPLAERRRWLLKAAQAGSVPAQLLVAMDSWAERTPEGHARARHWLELANRGKDVTSTGKYLAALLVSHSSSPDDWKQARELARAASRDWHDRDDPDTWQILAAASALTGDFKAAIEAQTKAISQATSAGWATNALEARLAAYKDSHTVTDEIVMIPSVARTIMPMERKKLPDGRSAATGIAPARR